MQQPDRPRRAPLVAFTVWVAAGAWSAILVTGSLRGPWGGMVGWDYAHYLDATRRWLDVGSPYLPQHVAEAFTFHDMAFMHPPLALWLFAPFLVLPAPAWWLLPAAVIALAVWQWRPAPLASIYIALALCLPRTWEKILVGNTDLWVAAALALGLRLGWPAALIVLKPSFAPLALVGVRHRGWWATCGLLAVLGLVLAPLWGQYLAVVGNARFLDVGYTFGNIGFVAIPLVAWAARRRSGPVPVGGHSGPRRGTGARSWPVLARRPQLDA
jgi:hypothetical protein